MIPSISYSNLLLIDTSLETDMTEIYTRRLTIGRNLQRPKKNH